MEIAVAAGEIEVLPRLELEPAQIRLPSCREHQPIHGSRIVVSASGSVPWSELSDLPESQVMKTGGRKRRASQDDGAQSRGDPSHVGPRFGAPSIRPGADLIEPDRRECGEERKDWNDVTQLLVPKGGVHEEEGQRHDDKPRSATDGSE